VAIVKIRKTAEKLLLPIIIVLVLAMAIGVFYIGLPQLPSGEYVAYKGPVAKLNGENVSDKEFNNYLDQLTQQAAQYGTDTTSADILDQALTYSLQALARKQAIKEAKVKVSGADIDKFIKKRWATEEEVQSVMQQYNFATKADFRKAVQDSLEVQKFWAAKARELKMTVSKDEVLGMLEQIEISHILIGTKDQDGKDVMTDAEALKKANDIYQKAIAGSDFAELAKANSDDPGSKDKGGSLGKMPLTQFKQSMVKEFVDASLPLKVGEITKPVKSTYGYHIIKLLARDMPKGKDYETQYKETEDDLLAQKTQEADSPYMKWENENNQKALEKVEILDPFLRGYRLAQQQKWAEAVLAYEKALKKAYYKNQIGIYLKASEAYLQLKKPDQTGR
jgi:foldase protein PrsA